MSASDELDEVLDEILLGFSLFVLLALVALVVMLVLA